MREGSKVCGPVCLTAPQILISPFRINMNWCGAALVISNRGQMLRWERDSHFNNDACPDVIWVIQRPQCWSKYWLSTSEWQLTNLLLFRRPEGYCAREPIHNSRINLRRLSYPHLSRRLSRCLTFKDGESSAICRDVSFGERNGRTIAVTTLLVFRRHNDL